MVVDLDAALADRLSAGLLAIKIKSPSFRTVAGDSGRPPQARASAGGRDDRPIQGITTIFWPGEEACACHAWAASSSE